MRDIFIISDTHFSHKNFLNFKNEKDEYIRKFSSVEEMDELMIENWNKVVKDGDIVYHLGDVYFNKGYTHLHRLKGRKRLILGNHDDIKDMKLLNIFEKVMIWRIFKEFNCVLTHIPMHESGFYEKVDYNLHGHIHAQKSPTEQHINCCVEVMNYTPVSIEEIAKNFKGKRK